MFSRFGKGSNPEKNDTLPLPKLETTPRSLDIKSSENSKSNIKIDVTSVQDNSPKTPPSEKLREENQNEKPKLFLPIILCISISFGGFILGWDIGTIGGLTTMPSFKNNFGTITNYFTDGNKTKSFRELEVGLIISIFNIACAVGGLTLAKIADWKGRRYAIVVATGIYIVGVCIQLIKDNHWIQLLIGRTICGFAIGSNAVVIPMYNSEIAPLKIRGAMVVLYQIQITFGILLGNITNYICFHKTKNNEYSDIWKLPIGFGLIWGVLILFSLFFIPESALYLGAVKLHLTEAKKSFAKMNGISVDNPLTNQFCQDVTTKHFELTQKKTEKRNTFEFLNGKPRLGLRLFIGIMVMVFQQLSGINYFFYYSTLLFNNAGIKDPYSAAIILSTVNFVATFGGIYLVERFGRRTCLLYGSIGMSISMILYSSFGSFLKDHNGTSIAMIVVTCIYVIIFAITLGPVTFVLVAELYPIRTKSISMAICSSSNWIINFLISLLTPIITSKIGFYYGFVFSGFLITSSIFTWIFVPETKGKDEDAINAIYEKSISKLPPSDIESK